LRRLTFEAGPKTPLAKSRKPLASHTGGRSRGRGGIRSDRRQQTCHGRRRHVSPSKPGRTTTPRIVHVGYVAFLTRSQVSYKEKKEEKEGRKRRMLKDRPVARRLQLALDFRTCLSFLPSNRNPTLTGIGEGRRHLLHCILIPYTLKVAVISEAERQYPKSQAMKERYICEKALPLEREGEEERNRMDWNGLVEKQKHKRR
jgi:hypothetical protein